MANSTDNSVGDILHQLADDFGDLASIYSESEESTELLKTIEKSLKTIRDAILKSDGRPRSQSAAADTYRDALKSYQNSVFQRNSNSRRYLSKGFLDNFEQQLANPVFGGVKKALYGNLQSMASQAGIDVSEIPGLMGKNLGQALQRGMSRNKLSQGLNKVSGSIANWGANKLSGVIGNTLGVDAAAVKSGMTAAASAVKSGTSVASQAAAGTAAAGAAGTAGAAAAGAAGAGAAAKGLVAVVEKLGATLGPLAGILISMAASHVLEGVASAFSALKKTSELLNKMGKRQYETEKANLEYANNRMKADFKAVVEYPFNILKQAAEDLASNWKQNLAVIGQTQGYTKDTVMTLMSSLADRLRQEGLASVISGTDLTNSLSQVLKSGLSGEIAEEFAYQAVKMNRAVPTQDFFSFASSYASIAANAMKEGRSQSQAIAEANDALWGFTSNVLYASRELAGGFTTGLQNVSDLYEKSIRIARAAGSNDILGISGVLTSASAIIGAVAPDLVSSIVDTIYKAAVGGNSSDIVALRSLAGVNASNTEFLRRFVQNPQGIIAAMFNQLGTIFSQSSDAYMEKAEGYASLFGLSSEAFQRIDFNYLASQIANMNVNNKSLDENLELLASGQTTTSAEQQKAAEINKMMIDEGLAYVIDNELGQMIQQHMWEEQLNRELLEATYGVEIVGSTAEILLNLKQAVSHILDIINPAAWFRKITNTIQANEEAKAQQADVRSILEAGRVGRSNADILRMLTVSTGNLLPQHTTSNSYALVPSAAQMFTGTSNYLNARMSPLGYTSSLASREGARNAANILALAGLEGARASLAPVSEYHGWGGLASKSDAAIASGLLSMSSSGSISQASSTVQEFTQSVQEASASAGNIEAMIATIDSFVESSKAYSEWVASAGQHGIADFEKAVESAGYKVADLEEYYASKEVEKGMEAQMESAQAESEFYTKALEFIDDTFWTSHSDPMQANLLTIAERQVLLQTSIDTYIEDFGTYAEKFSKFKKDWEDHWKAYSARYLDFKMYNGAALQLDSLNEIQAAERNESGDVINGLAKFLTQNDWDLANLKDPQVQTNAILSKILLVVSTIMNQNNEKVGTLSLADSFAALSMGLTTSIPG